MRIAIKKLNPKNNKIFLVTALLLIFIGLIEITLFLMLRFPAIIPFGFGKLMANMYAMECRSLVQFEPNCARYDPELFYTLKPGIFHFSNAEFSNIFKVNKMGLRDDEESLSSPEVIVLGDSVAMGWGVEQDETYAQLVEKATGLKVLNAAISSYGSVRELLLLNKLGTSGLKFLIIHYLENDTEENASFFENKFRIDSLKMYQGTVLQYQHMKRYYPGKYFLNILKQARDAIIHWGHWGQHNAVSAEQQAKMFIYILQNLPKINLEKVKIIVIANEKFILALKKEINSRLYPPYIKGIIPLNIFINPMCKKNYYILDDHMNLRGHQIYAERIIQIIERNK